MIKKKHVLFIVENNPVPHDTRVWSEACTVKEQGYDVSIICPKTEKVSSGYEQIEGIDVYRHYSPFEADNKYAFFIEYSNALFWEFLLSLWIFIRKPFHIIHSANPPDLAFLVAVFFKFFGVKYIFDHHDICPENYIAKFNREDLFYKSLLLTEKMTFKSADIVISTNESYKKIAIERGGKKPEEVFVVRNGPRLSKIDFVEANNKLKNGFEHLIAYCGVIGSQENIDVLLRIAHIIVNKKGLQNIQFIIIGTGPHWKKMVAMCQDMGLNNYVKFTGYIPYKEFYEMLTTADLCINPEYSNPFTDKSTMLKIMDYMTFGKPIVMFETTEGRVTAGASSCYIRDNNEETFANAILELLENREKRNEMGKIGEIRILKELNWDIQKNNLIKAYKYLQ